MSAVSLKWWLGAALLLCLVPSSFAVERYHNNHQKRTSGVNTWQMPEGGSAIPYLLGAGITCLGAMFIRSRAPNGPMPR
jgi:hypothetical protein